MADITLTVPKEVIDFVSTLKEKAREALPSASETSLSKEAAQYKKVLVSMMRKCDRDVVVGLAKILTVMTGEDIKLPVGSSGKGHVNFRVVVPIKSNPNSHDYKLDEPVIIVRGDMGCEANGRIGNHLPSMGKYLRDATDSEMEQFFDDLTISLAVGGRAAKDIDRFIQRFASDHGMAEVLP